ncbi:ADP-polyphosphate phosphotransferase [Consotaella salsifontis]|uniref:Polyphosphate:AMP phosphotransferase n=1 Tax=Consotaella salsifontis TaxID=1365950 RepID=A0A1T4QRY0_9HYPH|nr:ADP-polyphosphate phosphotransferase [Consotaella salsifontis]SKA06539.1 Polyphosphate:AMP phosphotransferase [Consotaella salsifontis]
MKIKSQDYRAPEGKSVDLSQWATRVDPVADSKDDYKKALEKYVDRISDQQERLYASGRHSLLLIFQAMDAAGKDGTIEHVMSGINPQGCKVVSFKQPSTNELAHDFLWRTNCNLPERGRIGIFNRSYYEEVLVVRVHPQLLLNEGIPDLPAGEKIWQHRYESINDLEKHLHRNGTRIVKFFLHLSKDEQRNRFLARIDEPEKNWKFSAADLEERKYWDDYQKAYAECISATTTNHAPWYIIPADDKETARLLVSDAVAETMEDLHLKFPEVTSQRREELLVLRKQLAD